MQSKRRVEYEINLKRKDCNEINLEWMTYKIKDMLE